MHTIVDYTKKKLEAFLEDVAHLRDLGFPYPHSEDALKQIQGTLSQHLAFVQTLTDQNDPTTIRAACKSALTALFIYLPLLGFVLRSTDVRNAFEMYGPLLRVSRQVLGQSARLILSSEWDYSPFTYLDIPDLQNFVLIGLPAPEAANPLLAPLAGHELGHPVWLQRQLAAVVSPEIETAILLEVRDKRWEEYADLFTAVSKEALTTDLVAKQQWFVAHEWALSQSEETFCDVFGLRIFGESYLHAFAYLLAPNVGGSRPLTYPNVRRRIKNLVAASTTYGNAIPSGYEDLFEDLPNPANASPQMTFLLELADEASQSVTPKLASIAGEIVGSAAIIKSDEQRARAICDGFRNHVVPAKNPVALSDVINAGWKAVRDPELWKTHPEIRHKDKTLKDLLLKSIEVLEINCRMRPE